MYPPACLVSFHFCYYTFQFPNDHCVLLYNFCLFIDIVYIMQHYHHVFLYFFNHSSFQFLNIFIMANLKLFSVSFDFYLSQAVSVACFVFFSYYMSFTFLFLWMSYNFFCWKRDFRQHIVATLDTGLLSLGLTVFPCLFPGVMTGWMSLVRSVSLLPSLLLEGEASYGVSWEHILV